MPPLPKAMFSKPMSTGDSTLMMLLSLNLLLLVFFMLLNSMATYGKRHSDEVMAQVRAGYNTPGMGEMREASHTPESVLTVWRTGALARLNGVAVNRIDLISPPKQGNAGQVEMVLPSSALFDPNGKLVKPELVANIVAAAGSESSVTWQIEGAWKTPHVAMMVSQLAAVTGDVRLVAAVKEAVRVVVVPGATTKPSMGIQVQQTGERAGGVVQGIEDKGVRGE